MLLLKNSKHTILGKDGFNYHELNCHPRAKDLLALLYAKRLSHKQISKSNVELQNFLKF